MPSAPREASRFRRYRGPFPQTPRRSMRCRDSPWVRAPGLPIFQPSHPCRSQSNRKRHRASAKASRCSFHWQRPGVSNRRGRPCCGRRWQAVADLAVDTTTAFDLLPAAGAERKPYDWIDTSQYFTPTVATPLLHTTEGAFGVCARSATQSAEPPSRTALMQAAFGSTETDAGIFAAREMPHGATLLDDQVYFVVHAPHPVCCTLILVSGNVRRECPMSLTTDTFYWWCSLPGYAGAARHAIPFPAQRRCGGARPGRPRCRGRRQPENRLWRDPGDPATSWSVVLDVAAVSAAAHAQPGRPWAGRIS